MTFTVLLVMRVLMQVTVELSYFIIRGVTNKFEVIAVLLDMCLIKVTTAGQNIVAGDVK